MRRLSRIKLIWFFFYSLNVSTQAADKIRIAVPEPNAAYLTFPLAHKKGFFTQQNIAAEVFLMRGTLTMAALNNGDINYLADISQGVRGSIGGLPVKIVACYLPRSSLMVVSRPEIKSVKELKGKAVAVSGHQFWDFPINRQALRSRSEEGNKSVGCRD